MYVVTALAICAVIFAVMYKRKLPAYFYIATTILYGAFWLMEIFTGRLWASHFHTISVTAAFVALLFTTAYQTWLRPHS